MAGPDRQFWQQRFEQGHTPWDRGEASPQLLDWLDEMRRLGGTVAVPGCGSGHEVAALAGAGCRVIGIDYAPAAIELSRSRLGTLPATLVQADVLAWQPDEPLAAVYEQTCLCALHPDHWMAYAGQLHRWLRPGGRLFALFVQVHRPAADAGTIEGPPYHCDIHAMRSLFPAPRWSWPKPPYRRLDHPAGWYELALGLVRT